jgi:hypothetical protein
MGDMADYFIEMAQDEDLYGSYGGSQRRRYGHYNSKQKRIDHAKMLEVQNNNFERKMRKLTLDQVIKRSKE